MKIPKYCHCPLCQLPFDIRPIFASYNKRLECSPCSIKFLIDFKYDVISIRLFLPKIGLVEWRPQEKIFRLAGKYLPYFEPNLSNINKLKNKISTYLLFE